MGFELILPFLRPIEHLILDDGISEIMVNGSGRIFIERNGDLTEVPEARLTEKNLQVAVRNIARALGDEIGTRASNVIAEQKWIAARATKRCAQRLRGRYADQLAHEFHETRQIVRGHALTDARA